MKLTNEIQAVFKKQPVEKLKMRLNDFLDDIKVLESIYIHGGELNHLSKELQDIAYRDRQEICKITSFLYSLIRERELQAT